ncbi:hypothetical protein [Spirosoma aerolatum]|uniref:hypothetical protein n=1 Tax=Spirosoma aerolatum TaxID=1211326 RepID=UPI0009AD7DC6|nr:hypothetical protein [Spirosoma aerolatum]
MRPDHGRLKQFEGLVVVAYHKAIQEGNKLLEVLQFESLSQFKAVAASALGAAHLVVGLLTMPCLGATRYELLVTWFTDDGHSIPFIHFKYGLLGQLFSRIVQKLFH